MTAHRPDRRSYTTIEAGWILSQALTAIHLLEKDYLAASWNSEDTKKECPLSAHAAALIGKGQAEISAGYPKHGDNGVCINSSQRFRPVPAEIWNFCIGGYQVCHKWLKDRRGRVLSKDDIAHYCRIVAAIQETIRLMGEIDKVIDAHGGWPDAFITDPKVLEGLKSKKA